MTMIMIYEIEKKTTRLKRVVLLGEDGFGRAS